MGTILTSIRPPRGDSDDTLQDLVDGALISLRSQNLVTAPIFGLPSTIGVMQLNGSGEPLKWAKISSKTSRRFPVRRVSYTPHRATPGFKPDEVAS